MEKAQGTHGGTEIRYGLWREEEEEEEEKQQKKNGVPLQDGTEFASNCFQKSLDTGQKENVGGVECSSNYAAIYLLFLVSTAGKVEQVGFTSRFVKNVD